MLMSKIKSQHQILRNLLTKAKSTASNALNRPVDESSIALGKQIANVFLSLYFESKGGKEKGEWNDVGNELVRTLQFQMSLSIGYGFFYGLADKEHWRDIAFDVIEEFIHWWAQCIWVYDRENSFTSDDILVFCIKGFLKFVSQVSADNDMFTLDASDDKLYLASVHQKCKPKTRLLFIRECISIATENKMADGPAFLSPLFLEVVSGCNMSSDAATVEARAFTSYLFQNIRLLFVSRHVDLALSWIKWIIHVMDNWFVSILCNEHDENYHHSMVIFIDTLNDTSEILMLLIRQNINSISHVDGLISSFIQSSCDVIIPELCKHGMSYLLRQFAKHLCIITSMNSIQIPESSILNLLVCSLTVIEEYDALLLLEIVKSVIKEMKNILSVTVVHAIFVIGIIHRNAVGDFMLGFSETYLARVNSEICSGKGDEVLSALLHSRRWASILKPLPTNSQKALLETLSPDFAQLSTKTFDTFCQCEALLLGTTLILNESSSQTKDGFFFLRCLLSEYPHLGRRCLHVCAHLIQVWTEENQIPNLVLVIEFLCDTVARDAVCASGIWSLLVPMTEKNGPAKLKCMVIRMYPLLCKSNKRMYSRVTNALGSFSEHSNSMIRTTTSITIYEMAKTDVIRDVSDIISWVQGFLSDEEPLVTSYAILSLHHLILHGYLDFSVVVKVLKKKLVAVDDISSLIKLPGVVLEALIQLLGDASEEQNYDSDIDDPEHDSTQVVISVHQQAALQGLFGLAHYFTKEISNGSTSQNVMNGSSLNILLDQTFTSLSKYSIPFLGIEFEMIRGDIQTDLARPYSDLQTILISGFEILKVNFADDTLKSPIISIIKNLCAFEEEALGPALWAMPSSFQKQRVTDVRECMSAAREGTMVNFLVAQLCENSIQSLQVALLLECIQDLSLPTSFIPLLRQYILVEDMKDDKISMIRTLISQFKIERRAVGERRDYLRVASDIFQLPSDIFWKYFGNKGGSLFLCGIPTIFLHLSTDGIRDAVPLLWEHAKFATTTGPIMNFVVALYVAIGTSTSSPASTKFIQNFLQTIKEDLSYLPDQDRLELQLYLMQNDKKQIDILSEMNLLRFSGYFSLK